MHPRFASKWFELLKAMVPDLITRCRVVGPQPRPDAPARGAKCRSRVSAYSSRCWRSVSRRTFDKAFSALRGRPQASDHSACRRWIYSQSERLAKLALKYRLPATSMARAFADAGGAVAYGPDLASASERSAALVAKILGGARPAELPVERPTKVQLVVNLKTAKALGITIPQSILLRADEVIRMMTSLCRQNARSREGMKRRATAFLLVSIALLTSLGWTGEAGDRRTVRRVGILTGAVDLNHEHAKQWWEPFRRTLADQGWIDGKNVSFEFRKPSGDPPQFAEGAAELVRLKVDVIWAIGAPSGPCCLRGDPHHPDRRAGFDDRSG